MVEFDIEKYLKYNWITQKYNGILEIKPRECMNTYVLNSVLKQMQNEGFKLVKIFDNHIRAFER